MPLSSLSILPLGLHSESSLPASKEDRSTIVDWTRTDKRMDAAQCPPSSRPPDGFIIPSNSQITLNGTSPGLPKAPSAVPLPQLSLTNGHSNSTAESHPLRASTTKYEENHLSKDSSFKHVLLSVQLDVLATLVDEQAARRLWKRRSLLIFLVISFLPWTLC